MTSLRIVDWGVILAVANPIFLVVELAKAVFALAAIAGGMLGSPVACPPATIECAKWHNVDSLLSTGRPSRQRNSEVRGGSLRRGMLFAI